jgi:NTE family protein
MDDAIENVLILQEGGSLGAFGCGVYKALVNNNIKLDILSGTSIGGLNATIIAGSKEVHPEQSLENFWMEIADTSNDNDNIDLNFPFLERSLQEQFPFTLASKPTLSFYCSAIYGNRKIFLPRWRPENLFKDPQYFTPNKWTYLYDHSPLVKTLEKYVDYNKLQPNGMPNARLIITAVNVMTAEPLIFDSAKQQITPKNVLATTAYPTYFFQWIELEKGLFAWDGSLLSNTPLREVIDASPVKDKRIFLVENYPKNIEKLPSNLQEVKHRARDIMFSDKTIHSVQMSKAITLHLKLIDDMYEMLEDHFNSEKTVEKEKFEKIRERYKKVSEEHGAEIKGVYYITRDEPLPSLYENADFSKNAIKASIKDGEIKTNRIIKDIQKKINKK